MGGGEKMSREYFEDFIENKCQGYADKAGRSVFMGVRLSEMSKEELLSVFWCQEQENKSRLDIEKRSANLKGIMEGIRP